MIEAQELDLKRLKLAAYVTVKQSDSGKWLFRVALKHGASSSSEGSKALFSSQQDAIAAGLVMLWRQAEHLQSVQRQALQLWINQVKARLHT